MNILLKDTNSTKINILTANPAGNKTIFVLDQFKRDDYKDVAGKLLQIEEISAEQVGFIVPPTKGGQGRMEMCGQEFCGNASRSYGLYLAKQLGVEGFGFVSIEVSGIEEILQVEVDTASNYTSISMPVPTEIISFPLSDCNNSKLVISEGICHLIVFDQTPTIEFFNLMKSKILNFHETPAIGVMFYDTIKKFLTPVVWVRDIDSTYFEGSCGSGSIATAVVLAEKIEEGSLTFLLHQPEGTLKINLIKENSSIKKAFLQGEVILSDPFEIFLS